MVVCLWKVFASLLLCACVVEGDTWDEEVIFSNSWAVEVLGGADVADQVARSHGFVNRGLVSCYCLM